MLLDTYLTADLDTPIHIGEMEILPLWFDSMGAKSMATFIHTPEVTVLIDPGAAVMQPSYPLEDSEKIAFLAAAFQRIKSYCLRSDIVILTHYHYDHHRLPSELPEAYREKDLYIKNPNKWINKSQWERARSLYEDLLSVLDTKKKIEYLKTEPAQREFKDPYQELTLLQEKDFGDYTERHNELLEKWRSRMEKTSERWKKGDWLTECTLGDTSIHFIEEQTVRKGKTEITFPGTFFHGIEYAKTGWVTPVIIRRNDMTFLYSSDLQGPTIEDYAEWIIREDPDVLILDGPATYLFGFMLNRINLNRSIENASRIVETCDFECMIYDHHLLREKKFREHMEPFYQTVEDTGKNVCTAAEWFGLVPLVDAIE